ncbi:COX15/CtaA family protein [Legionella impletisoli]|uniref:Cytochrome b561 n=1 Tax=Legionella impletisoli TaxID=343510 RepID=A0A917JZC5_9GAMM|nr:COX15/CtaA family protein [Legionella impletisoli]GGI90162.1 cytochrome b561 [Legionella impletisoli]
MNVNFLRRLTSMALVLALMVVMLGAYTRLTDAGLGCPDWPGCYGHMVLPTAVNGLTKAQANFPALQLEERKAWTEMAHRYAAGSLGLLIAAIFFQTIWLRRKSCNLPKTAPTMLVGFVFFQAMLGMWTVTLKLFPPVVMGHLLGGMLIFTTLCYFRWQLSHINTRDCLRPVSQLPLSTKISHDERNLIQNLSVWHKWIGCAVMVVFLQIALGGWVSSNYAGIACVGFPTCNGLFWPQLYLKKAFNFLSPIGANYQGGLLDIDVRITIHFIHRLGAFITAGFVVILSTLLIARVRDTSIKLIAGLALVLISIQFILGIVNVVYLLPLWVAVAHNGVAALLFATMLSLFYRSRGGKSNAPQT